MFFFMNIAMFLCGFIFLFILVINIAIAASGNRTEFVSSEKIDALLIKIDKNPNNFKMGVVLGLIEHFLVVSLAILMFVVFGQYNVILGIVWTIPRIGEGLIQIYNEKYSDGFLSIAKQYSSATDAEKEKLSNSGRKNLQLKNKSFSWAMILWSIGTFAYSILFVSNAPIIGWLGIAASILIGFHSVVQVIDPNFKKSQLEVLSSIGGLLSITFEIVLGVWLMYFSLII